MSDPKLIDRLRAHAEAHEYIANADSDQRQWMHDLYDAADEIESLRQQLAQSQQESQDKSGELIAEIHTNDELRAQLAEAKRQLSDQQLISRESQDRLINANLARAELEQQLAEARAELEQQPRAVPVFTGEMAVAGMKAWDHQHRTGVRSWPAMLEAVFRAMLQAAPPPPEQAEPIPMVLHCPKCGLQHVDKPDELRDIVHQPSGTVVDQLWTNPPHRSHLCHGCGHIWRPADVPTVGVDAVKTKGKADSPMVQPAQAAGGVGLDGAMYGQMVEADFEKNTITFEMEPGYTVQAGRFAILAQPQPEVGHE